MKNRLLQTVLPWALLVALGLVCYAGSLRNGFVWDDNFQILQNRMLRSWAFVPRFFTTDLAEAGGPNGTPVPIYRPLFMLSLLVDYQVGGPHPFGFHLVNVAWHIAGGLLVYALLRALRTRPPWALLGAALFVCHPLNTENTAYIAGRNAEMSICFMLVSLLLFLKFTLTASQQSSPRWGLLLSSCGAFGLALLSKEIAVTFPAIIAATCVLGPPDVKLSRRQWSLVVGLYALVLAAYLLARDAALTQTSYPALFSMGTRCLMALRALAATVGLLLVPVNLHHERSLPASGWQAAALTIGGGALLIGLVALGVRCWRRERRVAFGLVFFAVAFSLTSNLVPLNATFGERWIGWPMVGLLIALAAGCETLATGMPRLNRIVPSLGWIVVGLFSVLTVAQNRVWRDDETLYRTTIARGGDTARIRTNLAFVYLDAGQFPLAQAEFEQALQRRQDYAPALRGLGRLFAVQHQNALAKRWLEQALAADPRDTQASIWLAYVQEQEGTPQDAEQTLRAAVARTTVSTAALQLAEFYIRAGRLEDAGGVLRAALQHDPLDAAAHNSLGRVLYKQGNMTEAEQQFRLASQYDRWMVDAHANLAAVAAARKDWGNALREYQDALQIAPSNADLYYALGVVFTRMGDVADSHRAMARAVELDPQLAEPVRQEQPPQGF